MKKGFGDDDYQGTEYVFNGKSKTKTGSVHPEIGKLRLKYLIRDMKLFKKYGVDRFYRNPYKDELELYPDAAFNSIKGGKSACTAIGCFKVNYETRAAIPMTKEDAIRHETKSNNELQLVRENMVNFDDS